MSGDKGGLEGIVAAKSGLCYIDGVKGYLCYRGIDNSSYYWLLENEPRYYEDFTGTGNAIKVRHPRVLQMVMDSLRLWVEAFHVDGPSVDEVARAF